MSSGPAAAARTAVARLAEQCRQCYQCGQCTSACPSGWDLDEGPRKVVRMVLSGQIDELLACQDVWRCSECGTCTRNCPMEVDTRAVLAAVRELQRDLDTVRCPERTAAALADQRLQRAPRIDNLAFGAAMVSRGHLPRDPIGAAKQGGGAARSLLARTASRAVQVTGLDRRLPAVGASAAHGDWASRTPSRDAAAPDGTALPFFAGCSLPQDPAAEAAVRRIAAGLALPLDELHSAGCCGHPARREHRPHVPPGVAPLTVCPACDASLRDAGIRTLPLWDALLDRARAADTSLQAAAPAFVPYIGCLVDREQGLQTMTRSADQAGCRAIISYPGLHTACCGALGGMFRGESSGSRRLIDFARAVGAPIVTTCLLCRDNVRSAARRLGRPVEVHFWPEFFTVPPTLEVGRD